MSKVFHPSVPDSNARSPDSKTKGPSLQDGALCPPDEEKYVRFSSAAVPSAEFNGPKPQPTVFKTEGPSNADHSSAREDQKSNSTVDTPFDAHVTGGEVVNGKPKTASDASHSASDLSDWTEDRSKYNRPSPGKQRLHGSKSKTSIRMPAPHVHADDFEDPISDEFWEDIWVACAEHNVGAFSILCVNQLMGLCRRRYIAGYFMRSQMILLLRGKSTNTLLPSMSAFQRR